MSIQEPANLEAFKALLASTPYLVVDFYATWCPPCKAIAPIFQQLATTATAASKHIAFAKVNVDEAPDIARQYSVTAMPTFLFFERGEPFADKPQIRGADPRGLQGTVTALTDKAKAVVAEEAAPEPEAEAAPAPASAPADQSEALAGEAKKEGEDSTVSGGYHFTQAEQHRSDWKTTLA